MILEWGLMLLSARRLELLPQPCRRECVQQSTLWPRRRRLHLDLRPKLCRRGLHLGWCPKLCARRWHQKPRLSCGPLHLLRWRTPGD